VVGRNRPRLGIQASIQFRCSSRQVWTGRGLCGRWTLVLPIVFGSLRTRPGLRIKTVEDYSLSRHARAPGSTGLHTKSMGISGESNLADMIPDKAWGKRLPEGGRIRHPGPATRPPA
jgi:hypothetical protein